MTDTIQVFGARCKTSGLSPSQQHQKDMLELCWAIYGKSAEYRRLVSQIAEPPLPEHLKPA